MLLSAFGFYKCFDLVPPLAVLSKVFDRFEKDLTPPLPVQAGQFLAGDDVELRWEHFRLAVFASPIQFYNNQEITFLIASQSHYVHRFASGSLPEL